MSSRQTAASASRLDATAPMPSRPSGNVPAALLVLASLFGIQAGGAVATGLFSQVGVSGAVSVRLGFAALILLAVHRPTFAFFRKAWNVVLPAGAVVYAHHVCFYEAIARLPLGTATTIEFLGPFVLGLCLSDRWGQRTWACSALLGVVLLCRPSVSTDTTGLACAVLAAAAWAAYIVLARRLGEHAPGQALAVTMGVGAVISLVAGGPALAPHLGSPVLWATGACVAVMSSVLPYSLQLRALRSLPAHTFSILLSLEPAVAATVGLVVLQQGLSVLQWFGVAAVVLASVGVTGFTARRSAHER
jgi:inner membrane transporter RhtA